MSFFCNFIQFFGFACSAVIASPAHEDTPLEAIIYEQAEVTPTSQLSRKHVVLNRLHASGTIRERAPLGAELDYSAGIVPFSASTTAVQFDASLTPVLDQGQYGTCVTFASTAALDMVLAPANTIDQQCTLELNKALGTNGWNGLNDATQIIKPLQQYGAVKSKGCNAQYAAPNASISLKAYKVKVDKSILVNKVKYQYISGIQVQDVKSAIDQHKVVAIGFRLLNNGDPISIQGFDLVINGTSLPGGIWACQQPSTASNYCGYSNAGHEVVVIGYDDNQQLFRIRNSWGTRVADSGDFYMTYDFFEQQVEDGTTIGM